MSNLHVDNKLIIKNGILIVVSIIPKSRIIMTLIIIAVYLALTFLLTVLGIERQMAGFQVFMISVFLTPIVGLFYIYSKKNKTSKINYYHCSECNYIYPVKMSDCPICMENGVKIKLKRYVSPFKVSKVIGVLNVAS